MYARGSHPSDNDVGGEEERKRSKKNTQRKRGVRSIDEDFRLKATRREGSQTQA